uniref:ER membrane protein complex subunit 7 beta-sandwich domain-containing protein n=1 Tax=Podospora anserina (strain S / ATCC MYA-4624 / DSM 980 / FGSC 10383) TaxID=515849 RepID=A0A090CMS8_PODAN|nr:Putative protein of unknown function [Podospora anserina S mat+]
MSFTAGAPSPETANQTPHCPPVSRVSSLGPGHPNDILPRPPTMRIPTLLSLLGAATALTHNNPPLQTSLTVHIPPSAPLPNPAALLPQTHATLNSLTKHHSAPLSDKSNFHFHNVTPGSYLLDIHCLTHAFLPLRVDISPSSSSSSDPSEQSPIKIEAWETFRGNDWGNKGEKVSTEVSDGKSGMMVVVARMAGQKSYFMERSSFSVLSIFKNPIILLSLVSMGLFFGMPKLIENMDPEMRAEWEEQQKSNPMNALMGAASGQQGGGGMGNFDMAAFLAGSGGGKEDNKGGNNGGGKKKNR